MLPHPIQDPSADTVPDAVPDDDKDWTWVLERPCPECGYDAAQVDRAALGPTLRDDAAGWAAVLALTESRRRPEPTTWSPLEYAAHVRDVHRVFGERVRLVVGEDEPTFANWDQDATARAEHYAAQDPAVVATELSAAAEAVAALYDSLLNADEATWARRARRSNGSEFTLDTLARYHLHEVVHHGHDVRALATRVTAASYDADPDAFAGATSTVLAHHAAELDWFAAAAGHGGRVLEIGSGGGRDARELEARGLRVRRTDVAAGFVDLLRAAGEEAEQLDPLVDELLAPGDAPYDGVWASASLLHVARPDLPVVLARLAAATRPGGPLGLALKEGDGSRWSTHGHVRGPRWFSFWREGPLREELAAAGWAVDGVTRRTGQREQGWLLVRATRLPG